MESVGSRRPGRLARKVAATIAVLAAVGALQSFATFGSFDAHHDSVPRSVIATP